MILKIMVDKKSLESKISSGPQLIPRRSLSTDLRSRYVLKTFFLSFFHKELFLVSIRLGVG